jgi:hypothetical protein
MKVELNRWLEYEKQFGKNWVFAIDDTEISLDKPCRDGARATLARMTETSAWLGISLRKVEKLFSFLSETKDENENEQKQLNKNKRRAKQ